MKGAFYREDGAIYFDPYKEIWRPILFWLTSSDPEDAHEFSIWVCRAIPAQITMALCEPVRLLRFAARGAG